MSATASFYEKDFWSALFPMQTNRIMIGTSEKALSDYIYQHILNPANKTDNFLPQQRVYIDKPGGHLRRTVKLDPVAEYFIYDYVYRNRNIFRKPISQSRESFGYRFSDGEHVPVGVAFKGFKEQVNEAHQKFKAHLSFDVASYFNTIYHHDLSHWLSGHDNVDDVDKNSFGQFLREIASGRSIDVLPQGIYPTKMLGAEFLKFIDGSGQLKSALLLRFMDDFHLFDNDEKVIRSDFVLIQKLLGAKGLNVNPLKTRSRFSEVATVISEIRKSLFEIVEIEVEEEIDVFGSGGFETHTELVEVEKHLSKKQVKNLLALLNEEHLDEHDAELILNLLRSHSDNLDGHLPNLWEKFPSLSKNLYAVCASISDKKKLAALISDFLDGAHNLSDYQLFWFATLAEQHFLKTSSVGNILTKLYEMSGAHTMAGAKILEIPDQRFGFKEIRDEHLKNGASNWASWASAMGTRTLKKDARNYVLDYFSKCSPLNFLVADCVKQHA